MKKKLLISALAVLILVLCSIGLLACNTNDNTENNDSSNTGEINHDTDNEQNNSGSDNGNINKDIEIKSIYLNKNELTLSVNDSEKLTVTYLPSNATNKTVNWTSTNPTVATVKNGTVTGINTGTTKIIVSTTSGVSDVCTVNVSSNEFTVTFNCNGGTLINGKLVQQVQKGKSATAPNLQRDGYVLSWDKKFDNITENITITAVWTAIFNFDNGTITGLTEYGLSLTNIEVPSNIDNITVRIIGDRAFKNATLKSLVIPNSITTIGMSALENCSEMSNITIGKGLSSIGYYAFRNCSALTNITVTTGNSVYHSSGNCLIETDSKTLILGCKNSVIPDDRSITIIGMDAFYGCKNITNITIPNGVTNIGLYAFYNCVGLTNISLPSSLKIIGMEAFYGCANLTSITIPNNVNSIGTRAFKNCRNLESVVFENPNGWTATYSDYINRIQNGILSDTSVAARYLTDYDVEYSWKRT